MPRRGEIVQVESLFANIYREPDITRHKPVITVPFEMRLEVMADENDDAETKNSATGKGSHEGWLQVRLPISAAPGSSRATLSPTLSLCRFPNPSN